MHDSAKAMCMLIIVLFLLSGPQSTLYIDKGLPQILQTFRMCIRESSGNKHIKDALVTVLKTAH